MRKKSFLLVFLSIVAAGLMSGCAPHSPNSPKVATSCTVPDFCKAPVRVKIKRVAVSECPKRVKTVVYKGICKTCNNNFPVSVREHSCCVSGGCK